MTLPRRTHAVRQHGQALVLGMLIVAVAVVSLVVLYNLGQTVEGRVRLTHAADAAAYSGALEQARTLNAIAYVNRTQIAHQVAMAHLVTLAASAQYGRTLQSQRNRGNPPVSLIAMLFGPDMGLAYRAGQALPDAEARLAGAFAQHDRVVYQVLEKAAASAMTELPASRDRVMREVLAANFSEDGAEASAGAQGLTLQMLSDAWPGFIERSAATRQSGLRPAVEQAAERYGFLKKRNYTRRNPWLVSTRCPFFRHELRRRGSTWLGPDGRWGALDTQSFHALRSNRWIGCYYREYAMGWGTAQGQKSKAPEGVEYVEEPPVDFSQADFWRWVEQSTSWDLVSGITNPMANSYAMASAQRWPGGGLPVFREVAASRMGDSLRFAVGVSLAGAVLKTTDADSALSPPAGLFRYAGVGQAGAITVTSAAETYFLRPEQRADGRGEFATLFRPYWQARLSAVNSQEALLARRSP
ncbi:pilus assembly protein TadG-related protein [Achromobacter deleyi]|uniref:pilus assembly protein TadG-related protein n=1 Tax=Achromobacter deleyi TaxID=1353891 RepID=UPI00286BDA5F|nr:pilus assembly protein TadG-related protein [Achromobacter deleyi]